MKIKQLALEFLAIDLVLRLLALSQLKVIVLHSVAVITSGAGRSVGMAVRSIWKGSISFGLVNIPVKVYSATEDNVFSFNQLCKNGHRVRYKKWCPVEEREVSFEEIKKGYEIAKDNYILIEKSDLDNIRIKTTKTIDIKEFVDVEELDPIFVEKVVMG